MRMKCESCGKLRPESSFSVTLSNNRRICDRCFNEAIGNAREYQAYRMVRKE